jgi:hypothetical protein
VRDLVGASAFAVVRIGIRPAPLVITLDLPGGRVGEPYEADLLAEGGVPDREWTLASGTLPPGLSIRSAGTLSGWAIVGTPTAAGSFTFVLQVATVSDTASKEFTMVIAGSPLSVVTSALPAANVGAAYSVFLVRAGGAAPYVWDVESGTLPPGIALSDAGDLVGTPTTAGSYEFTVRVQDTSDQTATALLTLQVEP